MKIYIRKVFPHDITHEISIKSYIVDEFFDGGTEKLNIKGKKSLYSGKFSINNATDPRLGGDLKKIINKEGGIEVDDLIVFYKQNNNYDFEVIKKNDFRYETYFSLFKDKERHMILIVENENTINENFLLSKNDIKKPHQRIFFGAPGTGKSYQLNKEAKKYFGDNYERVTFNINYLYGNFVGSYKPYPQSVVDKYGNSVETITYKYIEGPFMRQIVKAFMNPDKPYLILIEEINRANASAVFGDIFQLLDRDSNGDSEYLIATSKEVRDYLKKEFKDIELSTNIKNKLGKEFESLYIPRNLYIWATMNSADQGVMPIDTAFKRRWEFTYLGINDVADVNKNEFKLYKFKASNNELVNWDDFRRAVNKKLSNLKIPEDKLIGPYFISKPILESKNIDEITDTVKNKVLMYLYEDAAKAYRSALFAEGKFSTYSQLCSNFDQNVLNLFKGNLNIETEIIKENNIKELNVAEKASSYDV